MGEFIENNLDIFYWLTIIMLIVATIIILGFALIQIISNSKAAKKTLMTSGGLIAVLLLSYYGLASDEVLTSYQKYNVDSSTSNMVGMGLWSFYLLSATAIVAIVFSEFSKKFLK